MPVRVPRLDDQGRLVLATIPDLATASTTRKGLVELATPTEAIAGLDGSRVVTPAGLAAVLAQLTLIGFDTDGVPYIITP